MNGFLKSCLLQTKEAKENPFKMIPIMHVIMPMTVSVERISKLIILGGLRYVINSSHYKYDCKCVHNDAYIATAPDLMVRRSTYYSDETNMWRYHQSVYLLPYLY